MHQNLQNVCQHACCAQKPASNVQQVIPHQRRLKVGQTRPPTAQRAAALLLRLVFFRFAAEGHRERVAGCPPARNRMALGKASLALSQSLRRAYRSPVARAHRGMEEKRPEQPRRATEGRHNARQQWLVRRVVRKAVVRRGFRRRVQHARVSDTEGYFVPARDSRRQALA